MKKVFSVLVALTLVFALCVPALAGTSVDAMTDPDAKAFADAVVTYLNNGWSIHNETIMHQAAAEGGKVLAQTPEKIKSAERRAEIANLAAAALAVDYTMTEETQQKFEEIAVEELEKAYTLSDLGVTNFDPSDVVDNIADGFSGNDLAGLFDTMRNTITDLSDRLSNVFNPNGGNGGNGGNETPGDDNNENNNDDNFGGNDPTGDTAVYAVAGVAAAAAVVLVITKKKSK